MSLLTRVSGLPPVGGMEINGQLYRSELILMGLVAWFTRNITDPRLTWEAAEAFTVANLVSLVL